jgi:SNF family Na+-dependent transporter
MVVLLNNLNTYSMVLLVAAVTSVATLLYKLVHCGLYAPKTLGCAREKFTIIFISLLIIGLYCGLKNNVVCYCDFLDSFLGATAFGPLAVSVEANTVARLCVMKNIATKTCAF